MPQKSKTDFNLLFITAALGWIVPGAGHLVIAETKRAAIVFCTIVITFGLGIYVGSIGVIDSSQPWFIAQILNSPAVIALANLTKTGNYPSYGRPNEIGQIYTSITGMLNLLCIVNAVYLAHLKKTKVGGN